MNDTTSTTSPLIFPDAGLPERLGPPSRLDPVQQLAADELIKGPRQGLYGPFRPLLHHPALLSAVAKVGETLRYDGKLDTALREWTICVIARESANVFEWEMHLPLAEQAGVSTSALAALAAGKELPPDLAFDLALARRVAHELVTTHRVTDSTYADALTQWGESSLVELLTLAGYFAMVCWIMNVARTPTANAQKAEPDLFSRTAG